MRRARSAAALVRSSAISSARAAVSRSGYGPSRSAARPTHSATPTHTTYADTAQHSKAKAAVSTHAPTAAATTASATSSSGSLLSLGTYYRFRDAQSGDCLTNPAAQSVCTSSASEGWEDSDPITGLLTVVTGEFELVNKQSGDCLTASSGGQVSAQACEGDAGQLWTTVSGSGSGSELRDAEDGQCLQASGDAVVDGTCSTSDESDLWSQDGSV